MLFLGDIFDRKRRTAISLCYVLIKDFNTFMYNRSVHHGIKHNCCFCLESFSTTQILEIYFNICLTDELKNFTRKIKLPFTPYSEFKSILISTNNGK